MYIYYLPWTSKKATSLFSGSEPPLSLTHWQLVALVSIAPVTFNVYILNVLFVTFLVTRALHSSAGRSSMGVSFTFQYTDSPSAVLQENVALLPKKTVALLGLVLKTEGRFLKYH